MTPAARAGRRAGRGPVADPPRGGELLTPPEVAELLRCTTKTLRNWRSLGRGPAHVKADGLVLYRRRDVDAYLAA